ncbi:MAG: hypothetical protein [Caudoviricetes sp.]|nr:MAG: hypothetical protein [Caudoviricetes sp.]
MHSNNVVTFPKLYTGPKEVIDPEEISRNIDMMKQFHIQETIINIAPMIFNQLDIAGFGFPDEEESSPDTLKDGAFIIESLRAVMCKHYGIYHPFQKLSEQIFYPDDEDPEALKIVDSLNIVLKEETEI